MKFTSKHCGGKPCEVIDIDHTGEVHAKCACGETYIHSYGAYGTPERAKRIAENAAAMRRAGL
ncbi:MAG: hypothetical protein Q7S36_03260 [Candidatus Liptonbacteria bacterium]|nr:hypothetical protein [Candidatus Liptonbacteria bacterium]